MNEKKASVSQEIPKDYCIISIKVDKEDITKIGVSKVRNNYPITFYSSYMKHNTESINEIIPKVLDIIGTDTIYYINTETEIELLKNKCNSMQLPITNKLLNGEEILKDLGKTRELLRNTCDYVQKAIVKELFLDISVLTIDNDQKKFICNCLDLDI